MSRGVPALRQRIQDKEVHCPKASISPMVRQKDVIKTSTQWL
jgi:hypothetical protein